MHIMLHGQGYQSINMTFPIICTFLDRATTYTSDGELMKSGSLYAKLFMKYTWDVLAVEEA